MQRGSADILKENMLGDLEGGMLEYIMVGKFLVDIKRELGGENDKTMKVVELKKVEQENRMIEEFVQEFRRIARGSEYEVRLLVKEFKKGINRMIRRKLMEAEILPKSIEQ